MHIDLPLNLIGNGWLAPIAYCGLCIIDDREPRATAPWEAAKLRMTCSAWQDNLEGLLQFMAHAGADLAVD